MSRTILITGASSGVGLDAARTLQQRGWRVFATVRRESDSAPLNAAGVTPLLMDYTDESSIQTTLAQVLDATDGKLDALFNNGAHAIPGAVEDLPTDALRAIFESNLFGWHSLTRAALPIMRAQGHGRIVQCSSVLGFVAAPWRGAYVATKFALEGLTDTLRMELSHTDIKVVSIQPGPITTRFRENAIPHFERWIDWRASALSARYEGSLRKRLYEGGQDRFELPPSAVTKKLIHALEAPRPKAKYMVTTPTYIANGLRRLLSARQLDRILGDR